MRSILYLQHGNDDGNVVDVNNVDVVDDDDYKNDVAGDGDVLHAFYVFRFF